MKIYIFIEREGERERRRDSDRDREREERKELIQVDKMGKQAGTVLQAGDRNMSIKKYRNNLSID